MAFSNLKPENSGAGHRPQAIRFIRQKLERLLHTRNATATAFRPEVQSIIDALDAVNRDALGLRRRLHLGEHDVD